MSFASRGLRAQLETLAPPVFGKERFAENMRIFGYRPIPFYESGYFIFGLHPRFLRLHLMRIAK